MLYEIDADSDSYLLTIIPAEAEEELKSILIEQRKRGILRKQARWKSGIYNIYETKAGTILQNSVLEYCRVDKLWEVMEKCEPEVKHYVI